MNPLFLRDFGAVARKKNYFIMRAVVAMIPLAALIFASAGDGAGASDGIMILKAATQAFSFFLICAVPVFTAPAIAEERRADAIDVLRTTPLGLVGIVLWKFAARFGILLSIWFLMLPLAALGLIVGGVAVSQYMACIVAHLFGLIGFSSAALFIGCFFRDGAAAVRWAFGIIFSTAFLLGFYGVGVYYTPYVIIHRIMSPMTAVDWATVAIYGAVHLFSAAVFIPATIFCVARPRHHGAPRARTLDTPSVAPEIAATSVTTLPKPRRAIELWNRPLTWIELVAPGRRRWRIAGMILLALLTAFMDLGMIVNWKDGPPAVRDAAFRQGVDFARAAGFFAAICLAVVGGATITRRDVGKNFADVLLAAPVGRVEVMKGRFIAATAAAKFLWMLTVAHTIVTAIVLPVYIPEAILFSAASYVATVFAAEFGLRTGQKAKTAGGAVFRSMIFLLLWSAPSVCCVLPIMSKAGRGGALQREAVELVKLFQMVIAGHSPLAMPFLPGYASTISIVGTFGAVLYGWLYLSSVRKMLKNTYPGDEWRDRPEAKADRPPLRI